MLPVPGRYICTLSSVHRAVREAGSSVTATLVPIMPFGTCLTALLASQNCAKNKSSFIPLGEDTQKTLRERLSCEPQLKLSASGR